MIKSTINRHRFFRSSPPASVDESRSRPVLAAPPPEPLDIPLLYYTVPLSVLVVPVTRPQASIQAFTSSTTTTNQ